MSIPWAGATAGPLTAAHGADLAAFACASYARPHTRLVEEIIQGQLLGELENDDMLKTVGVWTAGQLDGLAAWRIDVSDSIVCRSHLLAVRTGLRNRGLGRWLKEEVIQRAREAGAVAVISEVHWENDAMLKVNEQLGANIERIDGDRDYARCTIPLL